MPGTLPPARPGDRPGDACPARPPGSRFEPRWSLSAPAVARIVRDPENPWIGGGDPELVLVLDADEGAVTAAIVEPASGRVTREIQLPGPGPGEIAGDPGLSLVHVGARGGVGDVPRR